MLGALIGGVSSFLFGVASGVLMVLAHLAADILTPAGIQPLAPVDDTRYSLNLVRAANPVANYGLLVLGIVVASGTLVLVSG